MRGRKYVYVYLRFFVIFVLNLSNIPPSVSNEIQLKIVIYEK